MAPSPPNPDLAGQVLGGTYEVIRELGRGGMGVVYEARHARTGSRVAVKVLHHKEAASAEIQARFEREAMLGSRLGHEHIVQVSDFQSTDQGFPYLVMELLEGEDLRRRLRREGPMSLVKAVSVTRQVALALAAAHEEGVVHRDLKPENIFLARRHAGGEVVKVLDFGLSKVMLSVTMATQQGQVLGTPNFMAPEQARGRVKEIDPRSDLFSLGLVLHNMLSGQLPFEAENLPALLYKVVHEEPASLASFRGDLPPGLIALVERATAKEMDQRHGSAKELLADLSRSMGRRWQDVLMQQVSGAAPAPREASPRTAEQETPPPAPAPIRWPWLLGVVGLTGVVLLVLMGCWLAYAHFVNKPPPEPQRIPDTEGMLPPTPRPPVPDIRTPTPEPAPVPDARNPKPAPAPVPDARTPKPETRNPKPETRTPKPEPRNPKPAKASLSVVTLEHGQTVEATLRLDGAPAPSSPTLLKGLKPGEHVLTVKAAGYRPSTHRVTLKPGERGRLVVGLKRE